MKNLYRIALFILIFAGLNMGLTGLFNLDLINLIFGSKAIFVKIVYIVVGASAAVVAFEKFNLKK